MQTVGIIKLHLPCINFDAVVNMEYHINGISLMSVDCNCRFFDLLDNSKLNRIPFFQCFCYC